MLGITSNDLPHCTHASLTLVPRFDFGRRFVYTVADTTLEHPFNIYADYARNVGYFTTEVYTVLE